jgi:hypothetical protein
MILSFPASASPFLLAVALAPMAGSAVYTPAPGSAERTAILKVLHHGDARPEARFRIRAFHVARTGPRAIAYVEGEGEVGAFHAILTQEARMPWRKVWGESDGGSNSCEDGARHYAWAVRLIRSFRIDPDALFPDIVGQARSLERMAAADPEVQCVGDLDGGPRA